MTAPGSYNANVVLSADVNQYQQAMGQASQATDQATGAINRLGQTYTVTKEKVKGHLISYDRAALATLAAATAAAALYQKQLSGLSASAAITGQSMGKLRNSIDSTFTHLPVARGELVQLASTINQLGITSVKDIGNLTNTFTKLAAATGGSSQGLASSMIEFTTAMGDKSVGNINAMSNSLVNLARNEGLASQSILSFASAIAPISRVAGVTENQVLGLSTAFSKAGADGYVAANTFNTMLENITQLSSTGAPELAKYSSVLGLTVQQFNALPRAQAVAQLFETINRQGSQGIVTLNTLGINGVRSIRALQSVVSEGDLAGLAGGGSTNNGALNKASGASYNNLADSLAITRNEMTQYGTYMGNYILGPTTMAVKAVNTLVRALGFLKPILAVPIAAAGLAGSALGPLMSLAAPLVLSRWLMRSPMGRGARYGFGMGRLQGDPVAQARYAEQAEARLLPMNQRLMRRTGLSQRELVEQGRWLTNSNYDRMGPIQRAFYNPLSTAGQRFSSVIPASEGDFAAGLRGFRNYAVTSPQRAIGWVARANTQWYRNSFANAETQDGAGARGFFRGWTGAPGGFGTTQADEFFGRMGKLARPFSPSGIAATFRGGYAATKAFYSATPELTDKEQKIREKVQSGKLDTESSKFQNSLRKMTTRLNEGAAAAAERMVAEGKARSMSQAMAMQTGILTRNMVELSGATVKASTSALMATARAIPGSPIVRSVVGGVGRFGMGLAKDIFSSPLGMLMMGGLAFSGVASWGAGQDKKNANMLGNYLNPIAKYNQQLGIATTNLANFSNSMDEATQATQKSFQPTSYGQVSQNLSTLSATAPSSPLNAVWNTVAGSGDQRNQQKAGLQVLSSMPVTDPRQLASIAQDMFASGMDKQTISMILQQYNANGRDSVTGLGKKLDFRSFGTAAVATEGKGTNVLGMGNWANTKQRLRTYLSDPFRIGEGLTNLFGTGDNEHHFQQANQSAQGAAEIGTAITAIKSGYQANVQARGPGAASAIQLDQLTKTFAPMVQAAQKDDFRGASTRNAMARGLEKFLGPGSYDQINDVLRNKQKSSGFARVGPNPVMEQQGILNLLEATKKGREFLDRTATSMGLSGRDKIDVNKFETYIRGAQNGGSDFDKLLKQQGPLGRFASKSGTIQNALGSMSGDPETQNKAIGQLATEALKTKGGMTAAGAALQNLSDKVGGSATVMGALALGAKSLIERMQNFQMAGANRSQRMDVLFGRYKTATNAAQSPDYEKNRQAAEDAYQSEKESQRQYLVGLYQTLVSYYNQRHDSDYDYYLQRNREIKSFNLQQQYSEQDFQKSIMRSRRDFTRQMTYQARSAAQSIYDPFTRTQAKQTTGAGTLVTNLGVENADIRKQTQELKALHSMGLSTQAIQTLGLADPNNAQQLDRLFLEAQDNPNLIIQLNAATATRLKLTKNLTQSNFNLQFAQTNEQFTQGLKDATKDYNTARDRAVAAQRLALDNMAADFKEMNRRSARDLKQSITEVSGDYATMFARVMKLANKNVSQYAPEAAATIETELNKLRKKFPFLFSDKMLTPDSKPAGAGGSGGTGISLNPRAEGGVVPLGSASVPKSSSKTPTSLNRPRADHYDAAPPGFEKNGFLTAEQNQIYGWVQSGVDHYAQLLIHHFSKAELQRYNTVVKNMHLRIPYDSKRIATVYSVPAHAQGGISTWDHMARISEGNRAEAIIPLDQRGQSFMVGMYNAVSQAVRQQSGGMNTTCSTENKTYVDNSLTIKDVNVSVADTKAFIADMKRRQRLSRLSKPTGSSVHN